MTQANKNSADSSVSQQKSQKKTASRHNRRESDRFPILSNAAAVELLVAELQKLGRLETVDVALVNATRSAARLVDDTPTPGALKEYAGLLDKLRDLGKDDDGISHLLDDLRAESLDRRDP